MRKPFRLGAKGFTLIEMIMTLCIFLLLAAAVFGIFSATLESSSSLQDNESRSDVTQALSGWLRQSLLDVPGTGTVASYRRPGIPFHVTGIVWGAGDDLQALDLQPQNNGEYTLRLAGYQPPPGAGTGVNGAVNSAASLSQFIALLVRDDPALSWRPLVRDVKSADWRFRVTGVPDWQDTASGQKPLLAEFTFQVAGASGPASDDFWIPPTLPPQLGTAAPVAANP
jgi:prepilin-type N-terminal cleavage/methylation domain-containing protein